MHCNYMGNRYLVIEIDIDTPQKIPQPELVLVKVSTIFIMNAQSIYFAPTFYLDFCMEE